MDWLLYGMDCNINISPIIALLIITRKSENADATWFHLSSALLLLLLV